MKTYDEILAIARETINIESRSIALLHDKINHSFCDAVYHILASKGRLVITGVGKSAIIAQKITATLNSTGTPAVFMHAADAVHGDLGIIQNHDVVLCISKSGNTPEIKLLVPLLKNAGNKMIALVGDIHSYLASQADFILDATVEREACPNNLAPTSSTTAQIAMGDALAVCLLDCRGLKAADFAKYHPGGTLGKRLYLTCGDLLSYNLKPIVAPEDTIKQAILVISSHRVGAAAVLQNEKILGIITDGDIRRMLEKYDDISSIKVKDIMHANPRLTDAETLAAEALSMMQQSNILQLIVTKDGEFAGFVHLHDIIREGII